MKFIGHTGGSKHVSRLRLISRALRAHRRWGLKILPKRGRMGEVTDVGIDNTPSGYAK
jgi:hypothetical protein